MPIPGIPLIKSGDDLVAIIINVLARSAISLLDQDVLVVTSKIVSKSEGRMVDLRTVEPGEMAQSVANETGKDPRIVELVIQESAEISRKAAGVLITRHRLGFVSANSGIDQSNVGQDHDNFVLLLPKDPDHTAAALRQGIQQKLGIEVGIIISDSHGRPFRQGNVGVAIGVAGMPALLDLRGNLDLFDRELRVSILGYADLVASAAHLVSGEGGEGLPVVLVRGLQFAAQAGKASDLVRPVDRDLYR